MMKQTTPKQHANAFAWTAETLNDKTAVWQDIGADGTKYALLEGIRDVAGAAFTYAFFIPAGFWDAAHWHTADARVFVLSGGLYLGYGDVLEKNKATFYKAGSVLLVPAKAHHFDGSDEDTVLIGTAVGPWSTHYLGATMKPSAGTVS
jgi:hypothetical protein